jgi:hypothetical protein
VEHLTHLDAALDEALPGRVDIGEGQGHYLQLHVDRAHYRGGAGDGDVDASAAHLELHLGNSC